MSPAQKPRKNFFHINKYERRILQAAILPTLIVCLGVSAFLIYFFRELINVMVHHSPAFGVEFLNQWATIIFLVIWAIFALGLLLTFDVAKNTVGPFERIIRELDEIIEKRQPKQIRARDHDELAKELLKRINTLIKK